MDTKTFQDTIEAIKAAKKKKKKVASTSVAAFQETAGARVTEKERIVAYIDKHPGCSREEIAEGTELKLQSVTGNVTHLLRGGQIKEEGVKLNETGRKVGKLWPAAESP